MIIAILAILVPLWLLLRRDFIRGLGFAVFFWVFMTTYLRIQIGGLPAFTIDRLMLIVVVSVWITRFRPVTWRSIPLFGCFLFWFSTNFISLIGTQIDFATSLKGFLDFVLEIFVFYVVAATSLQNEGDALRVLRAAWLGLVVVALLAVVEKHTGFNVVKHFVPGASAEGGYHMVLSTYPHRILLGTAMAMGVPLSFALREAYQSTGQRFKLFWPGLCLLLTACYYAVSRGPWLGLGLACGIMFVMGSRDMRKKLMLIGVIGVLVLATRPGVVGTLSHYVEDTFNRSSFKGGTARYRMELWKVAYHEISKSPWSLLFGCGPSAGKQIEVDWDLSYNGKSFVITSWDNEFAYSLFQFGFVGFAAILLLYFKGLVLFFKTWRRSLPPKRHVLCGLLATASVLTFMMTNVLIFAMQLHYLFWTVMASGFVIRQAHDSLTPENCSEQVDKSVVEGEQTLSEKVSPVTAC